MYRFAHSRPSGAILQDGHNDAVHAITVAVMTVTTPPNWYPDPHNSSFFRWWDGQRWTEQVRPMAPQSVVPKAPPMHPPVTVPRPSEPSGEQPEPMHRKVGLFRARGAARDLAAENDQLRATLQQTGGLEMAEVQLRTAEARAELDRVAADLTGARRELDSLRRQAIDVRNGLV